MASSIRRLLVITNHLLMSVDVSTSKPKQRVIARALLHRYDAEPPQSSVKKDSADTLVCIFHFIFEHFSSFFVCWSVASSLSVCDDAACS